MDIYKQNFTQLEQAIFSLLCVKAGEKFSQRDIAKFLNVSPTAVANSLKKLKENNLIKIEKTKTINFISLNRDNQQAIERKRVENLSMLYKSHLNMFLEESFPGSTIILFGSYSYGYDTSNSDIDIAIIGSKEKIIDLEKFEKMLEREININFYDSLKNIHKELRENICRGIVLFGGIEL